MGTAFAWSPDFVSLLTHWALPFLVVLGVLVAFHEMGHFLAARWVGVKVLKFSLGFGPKIFGRQIGETEYLLSVVDDFDLEIARTRKNAKLMAFLEERSRQTKTYSLDEVRDRLGLND